MRSSSTTVTGVALSWLISVLSSTRTSTAVCSTTRPSRWLVAASSALVLSAAEARSSRSTSPTPRYRLINPLDSKGNYSATWNNTKLVHWPLMGGLLHVVQRLGAWAGCGRAQSPRCTECNSSPINGQCTNCTPLYPQRNKIPPALQCIRYGRKQSGYGIRTIIRIGLKNWSVRPCPDTSLSTRKMSSKSMHAFLSNLANRQTDRQTDIASNRIYLLHCRR